MLLDLCCGGGHWVVDMAREFPGVQVTGVDLSAPQQHDWPANAHFVEADIAIQLPFEDNLFDLVHMRTVPSLPNRQPILQEIGRVLRPSGYVIFGEPEASFSGKTGRRTPALIEADMLLAQTSHTPRANKVKTQDYSSYSIASTLKGFIRDSTNNQAHIFTEIKTKIFTIPIGTWPQDPLQLEVGKKFAFVQMGLIDSLRPAFLERKLLDEQEFEALRHRIESEVDNEMLQLQKHFVYVWAKKGVLDRKGFVTGPRSRRVSRL